MSKKISDPSIAVITSPDGTEYVPAVRGGSTPLNGKILTSWFTTLRNNAAASATAAASSATAAASSQAVANTYANAANTSATTAASTAAAMAAAIGARIEPTKAAADTNIGLVAANAFVVVVADETHAGSTTIYQKVSGAYVYIKDLYPSSKIYATKALASAALPGLLEGQWVEVLADTSLNSGADNGIPEPTRYQVVGGALVLKTRYDNAEILRVERTGSANIYFRDLRADDVAYTHRGGRWRMGASAAHFNGTTNHTLGLSFNEDMAAADLPVISQNWEPYFLQTVGGDALCEMNWSYVSIDRTVNYRHFLWNINQTTHDADWSWNGAQMRWWHRLSPYDAMRCQPRPSGNGTLTLNGEVVMLSQGGQSIGSLLTLGGWPATGQPVVAISPTNINDNQVVIEASFQGNPTLATGQGSLIFQRMSGGAVDGSLVQFQNYGGGVESNVYASGTTGNAYYRTIAGSADWNFGSRRTGSRFEISRNIPGGFTPALAIGSDDRIVLGGTVAAAGFQLDVIGNIRCVALTQTSDANLKIVSDDDCPGLDFVLALTPRVTRFKDDPEQRWHLSYLAQDVEVIAPPQFGGVKKFLRYDDPDDPAATCHTEYGLDYSEFGPAHTRAIQQLHARIAALEERIST